MAQPTLTQTGVVMGGVLYSVGDLVQFESDYQRGAATIKEFYDRTGVVLTGVDVVSIWNQPMVPGNSIMGHVSMIKEKISR